MSRWSAERLRIGLSPGEAALRRGAQTLRLRAAERGPGALLAPLAEALADPAWQGGPVDVVLSQHFVRHVTTPPPLAALARDEAHALVSAGFEDIYGEEAAAWTVAVHDQPPQHGLVGAAVDTAFVQRLDALLAAQGFRASTIRPLCAVAAPRLPRKFNGWWALIEPGWMSLFRLRRGIWEATAAQPVDTAWPEALTEFTARDADSAAPPAVCVQPVGVGAVAAASNAAWQVLAHDDAAYGALALAGI